MLTKRKTITIEGTSVVGEKKIAIFRATIDGDNPKNVRFSVIKSNEDIYKKYRSEVRSDEAEFEDYAYSIQDEMLNKSEK